MITDTFFPTLKKQEGKFKDLDHRIQITYIKVGRYLHYIIYVYFLLILKGL